MHIKPPVWGTYYRFCTETTLQRRGILLYGTRACGNVVLILRYTRICAFDCNLEVSLSKLEHTIRGISTLVETPGPSYDHFIIHFNCFGSFPFFTHLFRGHHWRHWYAVQAAGCRQGSDIIYSPANLLGEEVTRWRVHSLTCHFKIASVPYPSPKTNLFWLKWHPQPLCVVFATSDGCCKCSLPLVISTGLICVHELISLHAVATSFPQNTVSTCYLA